MRLHKTDRTRVVQNIKDWYQSMTDNDGKWPITLNQFWDWLEEHNLYLVLGCYGCRRKRRIHLCTITPDGEVSVIMATKIDEYSHPKRCLSLLAREMFDEMARRRHGNKTERHRDTFVMKYFFTMKQDRNLVWRHEDWALEPAGEDVHGFIKSLTLCPRMLDVRNVFTMTGTTTPRDWLAKTIDTAVGDGYIEAENVLDWI